MTFKTFLVFPFNNSIKEVNLKSIWDCLDNHFITLQLHDCLEGLYLGLVFTVSLETSGTLLNVTTYCRENRNGFNPNH